MWENIALQFSLFKHIILGQMQVKALQLQVGCASRFATGAVHYALHLMHGV